MKSHLDELYLTDTLAFYRMIFRKSQIAMAIYNASGQCIEANEAIGRLIGSNREKALSQNYNHLESWKKSGLLDTAKCAIKENSVKKQEESVITTFGRYITINYHFIPFTVTDQEYLLLVASDVTETKKAEKALQESEQKFRSLVELTSDWIWEVDNNGTFTYSSPQIERLLGYQPQDLIGKMTPFDLMPADEAKRIFEFAEDINDAGRSFNGLESVVIHKDGHLVVIETSGVPFFDEDGNLMGFRGINRDITERKQMEMQNRQAEKMKSIGTLAGGIAHMFNNALFSITGNIDLLAMDFPDDKKIARYTNDMKTSAIRMLQLTAQLLSYSRGGKYQTQKISLSDFIRDTLPLIGHNILPDIHVDTNLADDIFKIEADLTQLKLVLSAVCKNSFEAMGGKGRIQVDCRNEIITEQIAGRFSGFRSGSYACMTITDDGKGMDEETKNRVFEPFFTTKFHGRGLGMAAVYGVVKNHDGYIMVDSELGKGTIVKVFLPACESSVTD